MELFEKTKDMATIQEHFYKRSQINKGYTGKSLYINLSEPRVVIKDISDEMKRKYVGGRGFGMKYLWDAVKTGTKWDDPENEIIVSPGPLAGVTSYPGIGKSLVVSLSPATGTAIDSNVGGFFGPLLKYAGWDALEIQGKSEDDVVILIDGDAESVSILADPLPEVRDSHILAKELTSLFAETEREKQGVSVISTGSGAENSFFGMLNFSFFDLKRGYVRLKQAGRGGIGTVFRDKKIKAVVVKSTAVKGDLPNSHDPEVVAELGQKVHKEIFGLDRKQVNMRRNGTTFLVHVCNANYLLPVNNYKYGSHPEYYKVDSPFWENLFSQKYPDGCWYGCTLQCAKAIDGFTIQTGPYKGEKVCVDGPEYETVAGVGTNCGIFDPYAIAECNFYCDTYGLDTISFGTSCAFAMECYERGILNKERTGGLELHFGNADAQLELLHEVARGEGFGKVFGAGIARMKAYFAEKYGADPGELADFGMQAKGLEYSEYVTKECTTQQIGYAMANKGPQHDETWMMGVEVISGLLHTIPEKVEAVWYLSLLRTWFGLQGICKMPWADIQPADNNMQEHPERIPEHVDNYIRIFTAVTGLPLDEKGMLEQSERIYNLQRLINIKMGVKGRDFDRGPYRAMGPVTVEEYLHREDFYDEWLHNTVGIDTSKLKTEEKIRKMREARKKAYEQLMTAMYERRGWTSDGVPKEETLRRLGLDDLEMLDLAKYAV
jgi:aldehyde:ferredoxin oxidoreductase